MSVTMTIEYEDNLRCRLEHGPSKDAIRTDAPRDNEGRGEAFSPTDLVGAALVSCAVTTMAIKAPKEGIPFHGAKGRVTKEMTATPPRKIASLSVDLEMSSGLSRTDRMRLEEIARTCPVALSLSPVVEIAMRFSYPD